MTFTEASKTTPWTVFDTLAATYQARPAYLDNAVDSLETLLVGQSGPMMMVDIGAGTGIFTRQLGDRFPEADVIGLEPNQAMVDIAETIKNDNISYRIGNASSLPFADQSVTVVSAASALHRFDRPQFYAEAARVLRPGGILIIIDNLPRPWGSKFHSEYLALQETEVPTYRRGRNSDGSGGYLDLDPVGEIEALKEFEKPTFGLWPFDDHIDQPRLTALVQSSSINRTAIARSGRETFLNRIQALHCLHANKEGLVRMSFVTITVFARRCKF